MAGRRDDPVTLAMEQVPREGFLRPTLRKRAGVDAPLRIGHGQTNSQPRTVRDMLQLLDVQPGQRVLDVGSGSGWTTALLATLVGAPGHVVGVELVPDLAEWGAGNLGARNLPWARIELARPGVLGWPDEAPYDRILVSAEPQSLPRDLVDQVGPDGVMVIPVAGRMLRVHRPGEEEEVVVETLGHYRFVPLRLTP